MYDELFSKVPDHPRLVRKQDDKLTALVNRQKLALVKPFIKKGDCYAEFGPGDCRLAMQVACVVSEAYGVDISDQRNPADKVPDNFKLVVYDGYELNEPAPNSIDLVFSDQLIEHFHPEDTRHHFELVHRILKSGGRYLFRTPHALTGPHDVSKYFCDKAEGFHLKEWTYIELKEVLSELNFSAIRCYRFAKGRSIRMPYLYFWLAETLLKHVPREYSRKATALLISSIYAVAIK